MFGSVALRTLGRRRGHAGANVRFQSIADIGTGQGMIHREGILQELEAAFPAHICIASVAPHDCLECSDIRRALDGRSWLEVPDSYIRDNSDILPLLSSEARQAFLPAWLRHAVLRPAEGVADMMLVHLALQPPSELFTAEQIRVVVEAAEWLSGNGGYGMDQVDVDTLADIKRIWRTTA